MAVAHYLLVSMDQTFSLGPFFSDAMYLISKLPFRIVRRNQWVIVFCRNVNFIAKQGLTNLP